MDPFDTDQQTLVRRPPLDEGVLSGRFWGELRVFLAVAKAKSFNRAAESLGTSQPTVSRQVKRLQDVVGSQLFVPTKQGVNLTLEGQALAEALTRLDHSLFALTNDLKAQNKDGEGVVRMSVTEGLSTLFVAPALPAFSAAHPKIQLNLQNLTGIAALRENQTDIVIGFTTTEARDISMRQLGCLHLIPVASKAYIQARGLPTRHTVEQHVFVQSQVYGSRSGVWDAWNHIVSRGQLGHSCETNSTTYGMMVKAGLGIGLLGSYVVREPTAVPLDLDVHVSVPIYAFALAQRLNAKPVRLVYDWMSEFWSGNPWFGNEFRLDCGPSRHDIGMKLLFNL